VHTSVTRCAALVVALVAAGTVSAQSVSAPAAPAARAPVLSDSEVLHYAAILGMVDATQPDSVSLGRAMSSKSLPLRLEAVRAAGQMDVETLTPKLRHLLRDRDTTVAAAAAFSLGLMRDSESVDDLADLLPAPHGHGGKSPLVATEAAWALAELGDGGREPLMEVLKEGVASPGVLYAAANLQPVPVAAIITYFWPKDPDVMRAAVYAVTRARNPAAVRTLLNVTQAADPITRSWVARGLARSAAGDSLAAPAMRALTTLVKDSAAAVRIEALGSLGSYGAQARDLVLQGTRDSMAPVRLAAAEVLATQVGAPDALWTQAFNADTSLAYQAVVAGAALQNGVVLPVLDPANADRWAVRRDWRYRAAAAQAAAGLPLVRVLELALGAASDSDGRVRAAAVEAIVGAIDSIPPDGRGRGVVPERLSNQWSQDPDPGVRAAWLDAMVRLGPRVRDLPVVMDSYRYAVAINDSTIDARMTAVRFIVEAWQRDSEKFSVPMRVAVTSLPKPSDPVLLDGVREVSIFSAWHPNAPRHAPHPFPWYEEIVRDVVMPSLAGTPPRVALATDRGSMTIELYGADAPLTAANFLRLMRSGYYGGTMFHRVVPGFVVQDGDHRGDGNGGPGYTIRDELNRRRYDRGAVGMALSGPGTGGSQYFVTITPQPHLDGRYTVFGHVIRGEDALDRLVPGDRITAMSLVAQQ
jgi:cyclophilin family peptidyl-prolyl cis-trans isomerase/HEAT repeat protein